MRKLLRWLQPILAIAAAIFIILFVVQQAPALRGMEWRLHPGWLALSALLMLASWAVEIGVWRALLKMLGARLPYLPAARIWFISAIVRYIPGNIWQPLSITLAAQERGIRPELTVTSVLLYQLINLVSVGPLAAAYLWATGNWGLLAPQGGPGAATLPLLLALLLPIVLLVALPRLLVAGLDWLLVRAKRLPLQADFGRGRLLLVTTAAAGNWLLWGASFAALTFGMTPFAAEEMARLAPHLVLAYPIAYEVGFLSIILPSGFGVREGALYVLLATVMAGPLVTVAALAMRLWTLAGEVIMALLAAWLGRKPAGARPVALPASGTPLSSAPLSGGLPAVALDEERSA